MGDALGAAWEGAPPVDGPVSGERLTSSLTEAPLAYTDDTQLTIVLGEHLLDQPRADPQAFADLALKHVELWRGYGAGMRALVDHWRLAVPVEEAAVAVFEDGSYGNGAAMRVAPVAVLWRHDLAITDEVARRQARATHVHQVGMDGAAVQAVAVATALRDGRFDADSLLGVGAYARTDALRDGIDAAHGWASAWRHDTRPSEIAHRLGNDVVAHRSVPTALLAAAVSDDLAGAIELALSIGGDADTIAAMAGAVSGAAGGRDAIPRAWQRALVDDHRGRTYVIDLARRLADAHVELAGE